MKYYSGIGSRETPLSLKPLIQTIAKWLESKGYTLRSGGANGADSFFEEGISNKQIYLPWKGFNGNQSPLYQVDFYALELAQKHHPSWSRLSKPAQLLMGRNCYQVLGNDLKTPSAFILCWTKDGKASGGTGQAIRIAESIGIPVFNLKNPTALEEFRIFIRKAQ